MKKAHSVSPNVRLKAERELRGWSQKYVVVQSGADHYYLSRWERGSTAPSPFYRQKLCDLFGKNAKEHGLLQESSVADDQGHFAQAEVYFQESLTLARQSGDLYELQKVLTKLG